VSVTVPDGVRAWFGRAQDAGLLGPADIEDHLRHAERFRDALAGSAEDQPVRALDLGTGAGLPGLVLAAWWPSSTWVLMDGKQKRAALLSTAVRGLEPGLADRVEVRCARAEAMAHEPQWREQFDLVVARSFGPPAVVAECAAGFLRIGGRLAVSEPPPGEDDTVSRWPASVEQLGLERGACAASIQLLHKTEPTGTTFPRRIGMPAKRPLF